MVQIYNLVNYITSNILKMCFWNIITITLSQNYYEAQNDYTHTFLLFQN